MARAWRCPSFRNYFAWRLTSNDLTGIAGPHENEKGLEDARRALLG